MRRNRSAHPTETHEVSRREFLELSAGAAALSFFGSPQDVTAPPAGGWDQGQVVHLIPTPNHERLLIKASFKAPMTGTPRLS